MITALEPVWFAKAVRLNYLRKRGRLPQPPERPPIRVLSPEERAEREPRS